MDKEENQESLSSDIIELIQKIANDSAELAPDINEIGQIFAKYLSFPMNEMLLSSMNSKVIDVLKQLDEQIDQTNQAISSIQNEVSFSSMLKNDSFLSTTKYKKMFEVYANKELEVVSMPYPPLCGAIPPIPGEPLPIGSFVAAKFDNEYILCCIHGVVDDKYIIGDVLNDPDVKSVISQSDAIPMPTTLPDMKIKGTEYPPGTKVLALWPEGSDWTSVFYTATVLKSPSETGAGYKLKFDGDGEKATFVPEKFVIVHR